MGKRKSKGKVNQPRRPTGEIQARFLNFTPGKPVKLSSVVSYKLPEVKNEAEKVVMGKLVDLCLTFPFFPFVLDYQKFPTDHGPDFVLRTCDGTEYAELVEIAPLTGPYSEAKRVCIVGEYIDFVCEQIDIKIRKYKSKKEFRPIHLVMYVSHYVFSPDMPTTAALRQIINSRRIGVFSTITLILFAYDGSPTAVRMYPFKKELSKNEVREICRKQMVSPDPALARVVEDKSKGNEIDVTVRQYLPKGTDMRPYEELIRSQKMRSQKKS